MNINEIGNFIHKKQGQLEHITSELDKLNSDLSFYKERKGFIEEAQLIVQQVAQQTQSQLEFFVSEIVSMALDIVFDDPYEFKLEFVLRRGKTEADLFFIKNGNKIDPLEASGGGAADIASFALRACIWSLSKKYRNVLIIDEPFKNLSVDLHSKAALMLKEISNKLNLQIIMVTHEQELIETADRIFLIDQEKGISFVKQITYNDK